MDSLERTDISHGSQEYPRDRDSRSKESSTTWHGSALFGGARNPSLYQSNPYGSSPGPGSVDGTQTRWDIAASSHPYQIATAGQQTPMAGPSSGTQHPSSETSPFQAGPSSSTRFHSSEVAGMHHNSYLPGVNYDSRTGVISPQGISQQYYPQPSEGQAQGQFSMEGRANLFHHEASQPSPLELGSHVWAHQSGASEHAGVYPHKAAAGGSRGKRRKPDDVAVSQPSQRRWVIPESLDEDDLQGHSMPSLTGRRNPQSSSRGSDPAVWQGTVQSRRTITPSTLPQVPFPPSPSASESLQTGAPPDQSASRSFRFLPVTLPLEELARPLSGEGGQESKGPEEHVSGESQTEQRAVKLYEAAEQAASLKGVEVTEMYSRSLREFVQRGTCDACGRLVRELSSSEVDFVLETHPRPDSIWSQSSLGKGWSRTFVGVALFSCSNKTCYSTCAHLVRLLIGDRLLQDLERERRARWERTAKKNPSTSKPKARKIKEINPLTVTARMESRVFYVCTGCGTTTFSGRKLRNKGQTRRLDENPTFICHANCSRKDWRNAS